MHSFAQETIRSLEDGDKVPRQCVADIAHPIFALMLFSPTILQAIIDSPADDIGTIFCGIGLTKDVPRMTLRDSTLGGLLSQHSPARAGKTIVVLNIRSAAQETNDLVYSFSGGPGQDTCCAKFFLLDFFAEVQQEFIAKKQAQSSKVQPI